jgi:anti-sigma-K factor RskA
MDLRDKPELMDRLAAAYALGTLRGGARRRFETVARSSPMLRVSAQVWQERLMSLTELQMGETPDANVWKRIENLVAAERPARVAPVADPGADLLRRARNWWRGAALAAGVAGVAALAVSLNLRGTLLDQETQLAQARQQGLTLVRQNTELMAQLRAQPEIRYVSVLHDDKATPTMLVTFDPKHNRLVLKRVGGFQEGPDKSLQLWALPAGGAPRSLGVLGSEEVARLPAVEQVVGQSPAMAISLEPKGGVPSEGGPTGPVIFKGVVLQTPI